MDYEAFAAEFEKLTGICLNLYKEKQMKRRICTLIERKKLDGFADLLKRIETDSLERAAFLDYITINVTDFFRTPEHWESFEQDVLAELAESRAGELKIWSCACATGQEPYSIAMSLAQITDLSGVRILASDLDEKVLKFAEEGLYEGKAVENLPQDLLDRYFVREGSRYRISDAVQSCVEFRKLDLMRDAYPTDLDLIVCRNVLIYFKEEAKNEIYRRFYESLRPEGYLFTGNTEQLIYYKKYGFQKMRNHLYKKRRDS